MAVDTFARLTAAKTAELSSSAPGKGGNMIALPYGGTVGDIGSAYRDAEFASAATSVEAAHAQAITGGKARVVVNGLNWVANGSLTTFTLPIEFVGGATCSAGGFTLNFTKGFRAGDMDAIFSPADATRITLPSWQRLTPFHYGAKADYVPADRGTYNFGTDDGDALIAWASHLCQRVLPKGRYRTTKTVNLNGDNIYAVENGIRAEPEAEIWQSTDNIPVMTFYGYRSEWRFPKVGYINPQPTTNWGAWGLVCTTKPGWGNGLYLSHVPFIQVYHAMGGLLFPGAFESTAAALAASGATTITVANAQTDGDGAYPWVPGMYVQIRTSAGAWHVTRLTGVAGAVLTLADALPAAVNPGSRVAHSGSLLSGASDPVASAVCYSNTFGYEYYYNCSRFALLDCGLGTQNAHENIYIGAVLGIPSFPSQTLVSAIRTKFRNDDKWGIVNVEHVACTSNAIHFGADSVNIGNVHFESVRLKSNGTGLIGGPTRNLSVRNVQAVYCSILAEDGYAAAALFAPSEPTTTAIGGNKGVWRIDNLDTTKNFFSPGVAFLVRDSSGNRSNVQIGAWNVDRDSGIYPTGQLSSTVNGGIVVRIDSLFPANVVAYRLDADITSTVAQDMFPSTKGQFKVNKLAYMWPSRSPTTATAGVFRESGAVNLVSTVNNTALSALTTKFGNAPGSIIEPGLAAAEATILRGAGQRLFFKCLAAETAPAAVTGTSSYLSGRNGGTGSTNLGFINFAAAHGFIAGDVVTMTGSVHTSLNVTFKIVDVPTTTQIVVYVEAGSVTASISGNTITVTAVSPGATNLRVGSTLRIGTSFGAGTVTITALGTGTGGVGTYTFTGTPQTVASTSMVISTGSAASPITDAAIAVQLRPTVNVFAFGEEYGF